MKSAKQESRHFSDERFKLGPDGLVDFNGTPHPRIPDDVYDKFSKYVPAVVLSPTDEDYYIDDEANITQSDWEEISSNPKLYAYQIHSTMTDVDIMVLSEDNNKNTVAECGPEVFDMLISGESEGVDEFCIENGLIIVDDEYDDLYYLKSKKCWILNNDVGTFILDIVARVSDRF